MNLFFGEAKLAILDCLSGERKTVEQWPFIIGDTDACDLLIEGSESQCEISTSGRDHIFNVRAGEGVLLDGATTSTSALKRNKNYSLKVGDELFVFSLTKDPEVTTGMLDCKKLARESLVPCHSAAQHRSCFLFPASWHHASAYSCPLVNRR